MIGPISYKRNIVPPAPKREPRFYSALGWEGGYSFRQFWGNCYALLGDLGNLDGVQQLCHHYYLQNGALGARATVQRIKKFLAVDKVVDSGEQ